jgi:hypothetical protein
MSNEAVLKEELAFYFVLGLRLMLVALSGDIVEYVTVT